MLDLLIKNARISTEPAAPSFMGDLGVQDGVIRSVGKANGHTAERVSTPRGWCWRRASSIRTRTTTRRSRGTRW